MLRLENVSKYYYSNDTVALGLRKVSLELKLGEFVAITGESGSGKSTLLNVISGLDTYEDGELFVNGEETSYYTIEEWESYRRQYIGFIFQNYNIIDSYSVLENVMLALTIQGYDKDKRKKRALELIDKVGLSSHVHHKAAKLSGGQKQRAVIARALAKDCPIIVADEPTGNLDSKTGEQIVELLQEISKDKLVVVVTHNYEQVEKFATRKIRLFDGEVVEDKIISKQKDGVEGITLAKYKMSFLTLLQIGLKNLIRTPKRTIFTVIVGMFIALAFMFSFGSYVKGTSSGVSYGGGVFNNVSERRIIVTNFDGSPFTETDIQSLKSFNETLCVLNHDVILDSIVSVYYEDYGYINSNNYYISPACMLSRNELVAGRLPESKFEVVVEEDTSYKVGDTITISIGDIYAYDNTLPDNGSTFTVVGIVPSLTSTSWIGNMYFHKDFVNSNEVIQNAYLGYGWGRQITEQSYFIKNDDNTFPADIWGNLIVDENVPDRSIQIGIDLLNELSNKITGQDYQEDPTFYDDYMFIISGMTNFYTKDVNLVIDGEYTPNGASSSEKDYYGYSMAINSSTMSELLPSDDYQVTVFVRDSFDAEKVIPKIENLGFNPIYPASIGNEMDGLFQIFKVIWFSILTVILMFVVYWVTYAVLRNVQSAKKKDYLIFRSIGASKKDLYKITNIELVYAFFTSMIIVIAFFIYNEISQIWIIPQYLRYFTVGTYLVLFMLLFTLAIMLGRRFNKRIFASSVITSLRQE
jgi:ABC-type lipoprotein export system ATPase subunit